MYLGVVLHSAIAYKAGYHPRYWIRDSDFTSFFYDHLYFWIHSFRMPLFFLLSGFFTVLLFNKIGFKAFAKNRFNRIVVPLIACVIFILPISIAPFTFSRLYLDGGVPISEAFDLTLQEIFRLITFQEFKGLQHFWFLLNLIYFYLGFLLLQRLGFRIDQIVRFAPSKGWWFLLVTVLLTFGVLLLYYRDLTPSIWTGLLPRNPQLLYYGINFFFGWCVFFNMHLLEFFKKHSNLFLGFGTLLSIVNVYLVNYFFSDAVFSTELILYKASYAAQNMLLSFGLIGFCLKYLNGKSEVIKYTSDASYWVYIIHLVLVAAFQIFCIHFHVQPEIRFFVTLIGASIISYLSYHLFVRYTFIGFYLHGKRERKS